MALSVYHVWWFDYPQVIAVTSLPIKVDASGSVYKPLPAI